MDARVPALSHPAAAAIEIVQYGDFGCLDCGRAAITLQSFRQRFQRRVRFSYRHFPLNSARSESIVAAEAAECARAQDAFWKMHDLLMRNQDRLELQYVYDYAEQTGLDMKRFGTEMDEEVYLPVIHAHMAEGIGIGLTRTPAFLVNGTRVDGSNGLSALYEATESAIALADERGGMHPARSNQRQAEQFAW